MKKIYSLIIAGALVAGLVAIAPAQGAGPKGGTKQGPPSGQGAGRQGNRVRMNDVFAKIQPPLTADQKKKIDAIMKSSREEMQKLFGGQARPGQGGAQNKQGAQNGQRGAQNGRPQVDREKLMSLMKKRNDQILKVLNPKQQASFKKLTEDMMKRMQQGRGGQNGQRPPAGGAKAGGQKGGG